MARVILDTNFLLLPYQEKIDIFTEIQEVVQDKVEFAIIDKTAGELEKLVHQGSMQERMAARLGATFVRELQKQGKLKTIRTIFARDVDDALLKRAGKHDYVATQDKALKELLKGLGVKVLTLRGHRVVLEHK